MGVSDGIEVLMNTTYTEPMQLKHYLKIDDEWYRSICSECSTPLKGIYAKMCMSCVSDSMKGKVHVVHNQPHTRATKRLISLKKTKAWDECDYSAKHRKMREKYGHASICENANCTYENPKRYEWANLDHKYGESRDEWMMLCVSCHRLYDRGKIEL